MENKRVTFNTAKLAKEKGFNVMCNDFIDIYNEESELMGYIGDNFEEKYNMAEDFINYYLPTQSLLQRWLREVHNIEVLVSRIPPEAILASKTSGKSILKNYNCYVWNYNSNPRVLNNGTFQDVYEEALEIGLQEALKLIP